MQIISAPSGIKSVQRGVVSVTGAQNVAVAPVVMGKSFLNVAGHRGFDSYSGDKTPYSKSASGQLTTTTNIEFISMIGSGAVYVSWELIEYA